MKRKQYLKGYRQRPEVKEAHRKYQSEWCRKNRQKALDISRRKWEKNKDNINERRREKYATDTAYRQRVITAIKAKTSPEYRKKYRQNVLIQREAEMREQLHDSYVIQVIKKSLGYRIKRKDIPKQLVELERIKIFTHRKLKQL